MDPPYGKGLEKEILYTLSEKKFSNENCLIVVEAALDEDFDYVDDLGFTIYKNKEYKSNKHVFMQKRIEEE